MKNIIFCIAPTVMLITGAIFAQSPETKRSFEVASIKPNTSGTNFVRMGGPGGGNGRFNGENVTLRMLLQNAYRIRDFQIVGGPAWISTDRWNVEAKAEDGSIPPPTGPPDPNTPNPMSLMLQSLLEDRFQLKVHKETRELPIYTLSVGKDGSKLKAVDAPPRPTPGQAAPAPPPPPPPAGGGLPTNFAPPPGLMMMMPGGMAGSAMTMAQIINVLSGQLARTVVDKTELKGYYDVRLQFAPESAPGGALGFGGPAGGPGGAPVPPPGASDPLGPSIFTAVQEQLGLKLESTKGPVDVIVIDSVQKPTEN
jgi:uncharacterized protein (TIGR03435 family)